MSIFHFYSRSCQLKWINVAVLLECTEIRFSYYVLLSSISSGSRAGTWWLTECCRSWTSTWGTRVRTRAWLEPAWTRTTPQRCSPCWVRAARCAQMTRHKNKLRCDCRGALPNEMISQKTVLMQVRRSYLVPLNRKGCNGMTKRDFDL